MYISYMYICVVTTFRYTVLKYENLASIPGLVKSLTQSMDVLRASRRLETLPVARFVSGLLDIIMGQKI